MMDAQVSAGFRRNERKGREGEMKDRERTSASASARDQEREKGG